MDERFGFAALGAEEHADWLTIGLWFPGTEGEVTYRNTIAIRDGTWGGNHLRGWRRRYHPIRDELERIYSACFRLGRGESSTEFCTHVWRWAWEQLAPKPYPQNLDLARRVLTDRLAESIVMSDKGSGPVVAADAVSGTVVAPVSLMGFVGRGIETGALLLRESRRTAGGRAKELRMVAEAVLDSFARLPSAPPVAEGFDLRDGRLIGTGDRVYLRALGEGGKYLLRATVEERSQGHEHADWLGWCVHLGDWLLSQEQPGGGFPRAWRAGSGEVADPDPRSSHAVVPLLVMLAQVQNEPLYLAAALRAGERCWADGANLGRFVGGTFDNNNVLDKEAGTMALEAYLSLFEATRTGDGCEGPRLRLISPKPGYISGTCRCQRMTNPRTGRTVCQLSGFNSSLQVTL